MDTKADLLALDQALTTNASNERTVGETKFGFSCVSVNRGCGTTQSGSESGRAKNFRQGQR
jgi:hypothetical protein